MSRRRVGNEEVESIRRKEKKKTFLASRKGESSRDHFFFQKKTLLSLSLSSRRHRRVGAPCLRHVDQRRQVEPERLGRRPRRLDGGGARHGLPREDPQPGTINVEKGLRPVAAGPARAVGGGLWGPSRDHRPGVGGRRVSGGGDDPVGAADAGQEGLEGVEPLEEGGQDPQLGRGGRGVFRVGLRVRDDARLSEGARGVGVGDGADLPARDASFVGGVVDDGSLFFFCVSCWF